MRFGFVTVEGASLPFWARLLDEGHDVLVWHRPQHYGRQGEKPALHRFIGDGLVPKTTSLRFLKSWILDGRGIAIFDCSDMGEAADDFRKAGIPTIGGCKFADNLEKRRAWGEKIAHLCGMKIPETHAFDTLDATLAWLKKHDDDTGWYFKQNTLVDAASTFGAPAHKLLPLIESFRRQHGNTISNILQKKIDGVALSTAAWWNGRAFLEPFEGTIEHKKLLDGDRGPATGCALNLVWMYEHYPRVAHELRWDAIGEMFSQYDAAPGIYDVNAVIEKKTGDAYFLEWTPRFGYDAETTAQLLLEIPLGEFYTRLANATLEYAPFSTDKTALSVRVGVSPYPFEHVTDVPLKQTPVGHYVGGFTSLWEEPFIGCGVRRTGDQWEIADPLGMVGLVGVTGTDLDEMNEAILAYIDRKLDLKDPICRSDAAKVVGADLLELRKVGYDTPLVKLKGG